MTAADARDLVLAMPGITEHEHFDKAAYRGTLPNGKPSKIFMTLWIEDQRAVLLLDTEQQAELHAHHPAVFFPVPNKWGDKGATFVELEQVAPVLFRKAVEMAKRNAGVG
ncbi:MAG: MmcQ/YjbR family DNA-binding protein [Flavobacteriales bacterium]|nr:MmcQ/YjbR family DNA-binding protein [Flavobacteriales bacterium]